MTERALLEPAILHLIFSELDQLDLLHLQRVCHTWRKTITTSKTLRKILWLYPDIQNATCQSPELNPLFHDIFLSFFLWCKRFWDGDRGNSGPWLWLAENNWHREGDKYGKFSYPKASFREMLPWSPPPKELEVQLRDGNTETVARIKFDNETSWLTFGLIHDLVENAWMRGVPWWLESMELEHPGFKPSMHRRYGRHGGPVKPDEKEKVFLYMTTDHRSEDERTKARHEHIQERKKSVRKQERRVIKLCGTRPRRVTAFDEHVFTNEFHSEEGLSFADIEWDEVETRELEPAVPAQPWQPPPQPRRRFLGFNWGR